jgi:hypothetical protein
MIKRPPSKLGKGNFVDPEPLLALMENWPNSWAGSDADISVGNGLVAVMRPFIVYLCSLGLVRSTVRNHLDNCWAIGGEIIRDVVMESVSRRLPPKNYFSMLALLVMPRWSAGLLRKSSVVSTLPLGNSGNSSPTMLRVDGLYP